MLSLEGKQLGNYDIIRRIRVGGMGAVYEGSQRTAFDRRVAIKVILGDYPDNRDMKSSNILLEQRRGGSPYVYLADFGLVRKSQQAEQEQAGKPIPLDKVPGTPHYMAPEQTRGIVTTLTDIYAMGVLLYQMLTG